MKIKIFILIFLSASVSKAQFPEYFIDLYAGDVRLVKPGKKPVPVKVRMLIYPEDKIVLMKDGAQVTLVNKEKQFLTLNKKGTYKVNELSVVPLQKPEGITSVFFQFLWEELLDPGHMPQQKSLKNIAGNKGGGIRGKCDLIKNPEDLTSTADKFVQFSWDRIDSIDHYQFSLFDSDNNLQLGIILKDTVFSLDTRRWVRFPANFYEWQIESVENGCSVSPRNRLVLLTEEEYERQVNELIKSVSRDDHSHYNLEVSKKLYGKGFFSLADAYFEKAVRGQ